MAIMLKIRLDRLLCKIRGHMWKWVDGPKEDPRRYCGRCGQRQWLDLFGAGWKDE